MRAQGNEARHQHWPGFKNIPTQETGHAETIHVEFTLSMCSPFQRCPRKAGPDRPPDTHCNLSGVQFGMRSIHSVETHSRPAFLCRGPGMGVCLCRVSS